MEQPTCKVAEPALVSARAVAGFGCHGERGARAYNGGLGAEPQRRPRGTPDRGSGVRSPLKLDAFCILHVQIKEAAIDL